MISIEHNISTVVNQIKAYTDKVEDNTKQLVKELTKTGMNLMWDRINNAVYDGDISQLNVTAKEDGFNGEVAMEGSIAAFVEFGTGVYYPDDHPKAAELGAVRGSYGKGKGLNPPWVYYGKPPGSNGVVIPSKRGRLVVQTMGNPANKIVYNTGKDLHRLAPDKAKEVFKK